MEIGIGLAAAVALMTNLASLLKHRGCQHAQPVSIGRPMAGLRTLAASPWFAAGWGLAAVAWMVHVAALSLAPLSVVQAVLAGGAVTLAVLSQRLFGDRVERRQWLALFLGGAGLALLAATLPNLHGCRLQLFPRRRSSASRVAWSCSRPGSRSATAPSASRRDAACCSRSLPGCSSR